MLEKLYSALSAVIPPGDASPITLARWRLAVAGGFFAMAFHVAWACGWVPGLPGFAEARDLREQQVIVQEVAQGQNLILVRLIAADIETARQRQCQALRENNRAAADGWAVSLNTALREYLTFAGREYVVRPCSEY